MMNVRAFEQQLSALFHGGELLRREVRLTAQEHAYMASAYPSARLSPMGDGWFEVSWKKAR